MKILLKQKSRRDFSIDMIDTILMFVLYGGSYDQVTVMTLYDLISLGLITFQQLSHVC